MQNKRDQVQAHMFLMGRLTSSMLRSDPDASESPQGRTNRGIAIGVIIAVLISAGAFVFGLISPGTTDSWRSPGQLIVNKQTGARYLYLDGRLRPVRNYASALLLGGTDLTTTTVGTDSLKGTPHGTPVGIDGAPDSPPGPGDLSDEPWQVCSAPSAAEDGKASTTLAIATEAGGSALGKGEGVLVTGPDRTRYLLWQGSRLRLDDASGVMEALGYATTKPVPVSAGFLSALPAGPDLAPPDNPGIGGRGAELGGRATRIGQTFALAVPGSTARYYLLREDGLAPLTATGLALVLGDPQTREKAYGGREPTALPLTSQALKGSLAAEDALDNGPGTVPSSPPKAVTVAHGRIPCARVAPGTKGTRFGVALVTEPDLGPAAQHSSGAAAAPACLPVERVTAPPGRGALVRALGAGGGEVGNTLYLVTDAGVKHRLVDTDTVKALGYDSGSMRELPSLMLSMLPSGPDLSPEAAQKGRAHVTAPHCSRSAGRGN
ncbi:type VII secretion protein EccB [Streptomyces sp. NPDC048636]|uniref:type VII secretion protein EccB n=1 Tax=Streptomyces sp. NPDC048636 TaxID=3155762 RepID=UPI00341595C2